MQQPTTNQEVSPETDGKVQAVKQKRGQAQTMAPERLQYILLHPDESYQRANVRLILDEINHYDEQLPVEIVQGLLNPLVADFFILIKGDRQIPRAQGHYLHTSYIREVILLDKVPGWEINQ